MSAAAKRTGILLPGALALAGLALLPPLAAATAVRRWSPLSRTASYWGVVVALNALSTAAGGLLANDPRMGIGLCWSVALLGGVVFFNHDPEIFIGLFL